MLHGQDGKNRHRGSKLPGRYVLLPATTQLSQGNFSVIFGPTKEAQKFARTDFRLVIHYCAE